MRVAYFDTGILLHMISFIIVQINTFNYVTLSEKIMSLSDDQVWNNQTRYRVHNNFDLLYILKFELSWAILSFFSFCIAVHRF